MKRNVMATTANPTFQDVTNALRDAAYVAVGFGVLTFQRAQVQRRELEQQLETSAESLKTSLTKLAGEVEARLEPVSEVVEAQLDAREEKLPESARAAVQQARSVVKEAGAQLRKQAA